MLYEVVVPAGVQPGDTFQVQADDQLYVVTAPEGCKAGSTIEALLPVARGRGGVPTCAAESPTGEELMDVSENENAERPDVLHRRSSHVGTLKQLAAYGSDSLESPSCVQTVFTDDELAGQPGVLHRKSSHVRTLKQLATLGFDALGIADDAAAEEFDFNDSFLIQRSDGSYSPGYIQSYDRSSGLYHVLVVGAGFKFVAREQIELNTVHF